MRPFPAAAFLRGAVWPLALLLAARAEAGMRLWARAAGCSENPVPTRLGAIAQLHHEGCAGGTRVELETHAGGHEWPRNLALDPRRGTPTVDHVMDFLEHGQTGSSARAGSAP